MFFFGDFLFVTTHFTSLTVKQEENVGEMEEENREAVSFLFYIYFFLKCSLIRWKKIKTTTMIEVICDDHTSISYLQYYSIIV